MKRKKLDPHSPEVIERAVARIRRMTPEEAWAFLTYKTPGIEESDMTGMLSDCPKSTFPIQEKLATKSS